jgi:hypothetical protein
MKQRYPLPVIVLFSLLFAGSAMAQATPIPSVGPDYPPPWSAEMFVKRTSDHDDSILLASSVTGLKLEQYNNTHKVGFTVFGKKDYSFNYTVPTDGKWVHLFFVASATDMKLYVNGVYQDTIQGTGPLPRSATQNPTADSKDVKFYGSALTAKEVKDAYDKATAPIQPGLINCWSFNEPGGNVVKDSAGNNAGTTTGTRVPGRFQNAMKLTGAQEMIINANDITPPWSAALWVKRDGDNADSVLLESGGATPPPDRYSLKLEQFGSPSQVGYTHFGASDAKFGYSLPKGEWHHLAFVATTTELKLYVDGKDTPSYTLSESGNLPRYRLAPTNATVDEVKLFKGALSAQEIATASQQPCELSAPKLIISEQNGPVIPNGGSASFGTLPELRKPATKTFVLKNDGDAPLVLKANPNLINLNLPGDFTVSPMTQTTLNPKESVTFTITFTPSIAPQQTRTVTVFSNDPTTPTYSFVLTGSATSVPKVTMRATLASPSVNAVNSVKDSEFRAASLAPAGSNGGANILNVTGPNSQSTYVRIYSSANGNFADFSATIEGNNAQCFLFSPPSTRMGADSSGPYRLYEIALRDSLCIPGGGPYSARIVITPEGGGPVQWMNLVWPFPKVPGKPAPRP